MWKLEVERDELWVPLASGHAHLLEDRPTQEKLRRLYNQDRAAWDRIASEIPTVAEDPVFSTGNPRR